MTRDEVIEALIAEPDGRERWALLSDLLQQEGDPRGELLALDLALEAAPQNADLLARRRGHLEEHAPALLGDLLASVVKERYGDVVWRRGYVTELSYVGSPSLGHHRSVRWLVKELVPERLAFLYKLTLAHTDVADVSPLVKLRALTELDLTRTLVTSLDWVAQMPRLRLVKVKGCRLEPHTLAGAKALCPRVHFVT